MSGLNVSRPLTKIGARMAGRIRDSIRHIERDLPKQLPGSTNCFAVCMATVLGCSVEEIPPSADGATWDFTVTQRWLAEKYQMQMLEVTFGSGGTIYPFWSKVPCIVTGKSPRECVSGRHAVCAFGMGLDGFELWHDPHPSNDFLADEPDMACFFMPIDPRVLTK